MKTVKAVKIVLAAAMLALVTAAFFGAPTSFACRIQPGPTIAFLVVLLLAPLVGRLFCECFCPLGVLQSFVNWLFHPKTKVRRVCTRLPESRAQMCVRYVVLALSLVCIAIGLGGIGWAITPYSIYGKALTLFAPGVAIFALVVVLAAIGKGRIWCNWICPVGTLFGLLSKKTLCPHKVGPGCANCKACFGNGERGTGNGERGTGNGERGTGNGERGTGNGERGKGDEESGVTRRDTLKGIAVLAAAEAVEKTTDGGYASVTSHCVPPRAVPVLPPGSVDRREFNLKCVGCGLCVANCRGGCLKASKSITRLGQPEMDFRHDYCLVRCAQQCAKVCPTGAIRRIDGVARKDIHVGRAVWKRELCIRETEGVKCTACSRKCPVGAIRIVDGFPVVNEEACIGCGACEHVCPAHPMPAIFVEGFDKQRISRG